jgi:hypothetical protein
MPCIGQQKTGCLTQIRLFMHNDQSLPSIPFQPDPLGEHPKTLLFSMTTDHLHRPETLGMPLPQFSGDFVHPPPVALPLNVPRDF